MKKPQTSSDSTQRAGAGLSAALQLCEQALHQVDKRRRLAAGDLDEQWDTVIRHADREIEELNALVSFFFADPDGAFERSELGMEIRLAGEWLSAALAIIAEMRKRDGHRMEAMKAMVAQIKIVHDAVDEISVISRDIELLSYNAGFVAGRAGSAGAAFTFIASEIKKLSNQTRILVNKMHHRSEAMFRGYSDFEAKLRSLGKDADTESKQIVQHSGEVFRRYQTGLSSAADALRELLGKIKTARTLLAGLGTTLSEQLAAKEWPAANDNHCDLVVAVREALRQGSHAAELEIGARGEWIDGVSAAAEAAALRVAQLNLEDRDQTTHLQKTLEKVCGQWREIELERETLFDFFIRCQPDLNGRSSIEAIFQDAIGCLNSILNFLDETISQRKSMSQQAAALLLSMRESQACFEEIQKIVKNFSLVKVASKMELAREEELSRNITASSEMFDELTHRMEALMLELRSGMLASNHHIQQGLVELDRGLAEQFDGIAEIKHNLANSIKRFDEMSMALQEALRALERDNSVISLLTAFSGEWAKSRRELLNEQEKLAEGYRRVHQIATMLRPPVSVSTGTEAAMA